MSNIVLEKIHQVLGNIVRNYNINKTYVDEDDPWSGILMAALFTIWSTANRLKYCSPVQLVFGRDIILLIKYVLDYKLIQNKKQA